MKYTVKQMDKIVLETDHLFKALQRAISNDAYAVFSQDKAIYQNDDNLYVFSYKGFDFEIDSKTKRYSKLPIYIYPNSQKPSHVEYHTGAYNYLYSKSGYQSIEVIIDLSKASFHLPMDDSKWAGYILINHQVLDQIDIGLSVQVNGNKAELRPFYYYMGGAHPKAFKVFSEVIATLSIDSIKQTYDNIKIILSKTDFGWESTYINLTTLETHQYRYDYPHPGSSKPIDRFLVGVSLCPVGEVIWDPTSKAAFKHIRFESCVLNAKESLSPSSPVMLEGYTQGVPCAYLKEEDDSFIMGVDYNL